MTEVDPRTASPLDSTSINGQMTDRAIELIGMLNKVIGADGLGTNTFTLLNDELEDIRQTLSIHTVEPDAEDPHWQEKQTVYFGTAHDRLDLIQEKLNENLDNIKNDIASNVSGLFDISVVKMVFSMIMKPRSQRQKTEKSWNKQNKHYKTKLSKN